MFEDVVYLSRRNLLALLAKLDANIAQPGSSQCSIIKYQPSSMNAPFRQSMDSLMVIAVDDEAFYAGQQRSAGQMHPREEVKLPKPSTGIDVLVPGVMSDEVEID